MKNKVSGPGLVVALGAPSGGSATGQYGQNGEMARGDDGAPDYQTDCVPIDLLAMPDDQEQMQPPAVGDVVNYQVTGKVVAIEGDCARIERQTINGQEVPGGSATGDSDDQQGDGDEYNGMRDEAAGMGQLS